jgi:DNA repair protein SbcD/Mre11
LENGFSISNSEPGFIEVYLPGYIYPLRILFTPYANEIRLKTYLGTKDPEEQLCKVLANNWQKLSKKYCDNIGVNVLLSHLFMMKKGGKKPTEPEEEKPILHVGGAQIVYTENIPKEIDYTALGHLHRKQHAEKNRILYSGSPLAYSMGEAGQDKYVFIVDMEPGKKTKIKEKRITKGKTLLRASFDNIDKALEWLENNKNSLVEITLRTDTYITSEERKSLYDVHSGIVTIIPEIKDPKMVNQTKRNIDLSKSLSDLFDEYFIHKFNQEPNDEIKDLFKEIYSEEETP